MSVCGNAGLAGLRILVLEDDYHLAADLERALQNEGAVVVGPFPREGLGLAAVAARWIDAAVVDINLGAGRTFAVPAALAAAGIPFVFLTAYGGAAIPPQFADVTRFGKPTDCRAVTRSVAGLMARPHASS